MGKVAKVTISMPAETLEAVEREREARGQTRSEFFVHAVEEYLRRERHRHDVDRYIRGYQEFPESEDEELKAWVQVGYQCLAEALRGEPPWPEEPEDQNERTAAG